MAFRRRRSFRKSFRRVRRVSFRRRGRAGVRRNRIGFRM